jgi:hemolysin III
MAVGLELEQRPHAAGEEIANAASHAVGLLAALIGLPWLIASAADRGTEAVVGAAIFGITAALLYLSSTLYHAARRPGPKRVLRILDHSAIYLLIAGTYTPFTLGVLSGTLGWTMFGLVWTLATAGVVFKTVRGFRNPRLSVALYLAMGWLILVVAKPLWLLVPGWGVFWLVAGGLAYTVGVVFYANRRIPYGHFIWHLFVLVGTACHYVAVLRYAG